MKSYLHVLPLTAVAMALFAMDVQAQTAVAQQAPAKPPTGRQAAEAAKPDPLPNIGDAESVAGQDEPTPIDDADGASRAARTPDDARDAPVANGTAGKRKDKDDGTILVTGSRLQTGDVTSRLIVIDQADIRARGVTSVEELIRTLPQNVATIGAITNDRSKGPLGNRASDRDAVSAVGSLGVSAANLGGVGAGNTLVLVNGRRLAGAAGIQDGFVNLNGIPLSAVERVEISTGGASAVYGADALGGVINFVLKKGFSGTSITAQYENSANDADNGRISLFSGKGWKTGNLSVTVDYARRHPVNNFKSGYTTENYASYFNNDANYDFRSLARGLQPGVIDRTAFVFNRVTGTSTRVISGLTVPQGFTGIPRISDFVTVGSEAVRDYVPRLAGPRTESASATFNFEQKLLDHLFVFGNGLYTRSKNVQETRFDRGLTVALAPGQAYNPFPARYFDSFTIPTTVSYYPGAEIADGTIQPGQLRNLSKSWTVSTGLRYEFGLNSKLEVVYTTSQATTRADSTVFGSLVSFNANPASANGVSCFNFQLSRNTYPLSQRAYLQSVFDRQCSALTSANSTAAFNPFKSTSTGGGAGVDIFRYRDQQENRQSRLQNVEARLNGRLLTLPAGGLYYVVGAEYNDDGVDSREVRLFTGERVSRDRHAFFGELTVPIFSRDFDLPGFRSLTFNLAARRDIYDTEGAIGTVNGVPYDQGGEIVYGKNRFARTTPAFGARWEPFAGLALRARFTRGFQAPPYTNLFSVLGTTTFSTLIFNANDRLYQCTTDCSGGATGNRYYIVPRTSSPNPDLKPQTSKQEVFSAEWNPHGFLSGLSLAATYSRNRVFNQYADASDLAGFLSISEQYNIAQFYPRNASGKITAFNSSIFNISGSRYKSMTYEAAYRVSTGIGTFEPRVTYLDNITAETQPFADSKVYSTIGKVLGVDRYKIVGSLNWNYEDYTVNLWAYHTPSYENDYLSFLRNGNDLNSAYFKKVGSMTTIDLTASWQIRRDLRLDVAGRNIFDTAPPFVVVEARPYDTARYNAAGRTLSLQMQYSF